MWKVDLLETKYRGYRPRFEHTKKLLRSKKLNLSRLPGSKEEALAVINELKTEEFGKKYYGAEKKLTAELKKQIKECKDAQVTGILDETVVAKLVRSRIIKVLTTVFELNLATADTESLYLPLELVDIAKDKSHDSNATKVFKQYLQNDKAMNKFVSGAFNSKAIKTIMQDIEWSFKQIKGNVSKKDRDDRKKASNGDSKTDESDVDDDNEEYAELNGMLVGSDDDDDDDEGDVGSLDPNINYQEVTDEENSGSEDIGSASDSDEDDFLEENEPKRPKYALPELANGYYSGGSDDEDDDADKDKVVKELTSQRKNRRGQRARQKIWAQKYGKNAVHVKEQKKQYESERAQRQLEYEERCRKRELKAQMAKDSATGANTVDVGVRKKSATPKDPTKVHPSWEAKKLAEEKHKNVKFEGKKIVFH